MTKKESRIVIGAFLAMFIIFVAVCIGFVAYDCYKLDKEEKEAQSMRFRLYTSYLYMEGDFVIEGNNVLVSNQSFDEKELTKNVALYNAFYSDSPITIDMLMDAYNKFCHGMEESELIETYKDGLHALKARAEKVEVLVYSYEYDVLIINYLEENYNTRSSRATVEQVDEASTYAAKEIYQKVLQLEAQK